MIEVSPPEAAILAINRFGALQKDEELAILINMLDNHFHFSKESSALEIGAGNGGTSWLWNRIFKSVTTIDLPNGPWGGADLTEIKNYLPRWRLIPGNSHDENIFNQVKTNTFDFLFIDGDHSYDGVKSDFETYSILVRPGGLIAFHDICEHTPKTGCEVKRFWDEVKVGKDFYEFISEPTTWGGIGVLKL